jgi:ornithine cyclodeaminase/alanine dehydrogenase-like protein (mu-crystallin family)
MAAIYLAESDIEGLIEMRPAIAVIEEAFRQMALGQAENAPRQRVRSPGIVLHNMSASAAYLSRIGFKCYTTTRASGKFLIGLYDGQNGSLLALMEADQIGQIRTAATTGVAIHWMTEPDITELGLFGAGWQARGQLAAAVAVRPIRVAYVYCRDHERRQRFADEMSSDLKIEVIPVDRPQEAAEELPLVITATTSRVPVLHGKWLAEQALVCAIGSNWINRAELDADVITRADHVVCDSIAACRIEAGDFSDAVDRGLFDWSRAVDLADVVGGMAVGRSRQRMSLFKSVGLAIEDLALGARLYDIARARGIGQRLPL